MYDGSRDRYQQYCQQKQQDSGGRFEMTHFLSKLNDMILAFDINALGCEYDLGVE